MGQSAQRPSLHYEQELEARSEELGVRRQELEEYRKRPFYSVS